MKIEVNIEKKHILLTLSLILLFVGAFGVYSYTASNGVGHEITELGFPSSCSNGQVLTKAASGWVCSTPQGITGPAFTASGAITCSGTVKSNGVYTCTTGPSWSACFLTGIIPSGPFNYAPGCDVVSIGGGNFNITMYNFNGGDKFITCNVNCIK